MSASTYTLDLPVVLPSGPDCERCVGRLRAALECVKGVAGASVDTRGSRLHVVFDPNVASLARIEQEARRIGAEMAAHIDHQTIDLLDLDCPDCAASIEKAVSKLPGVLWAGANFAASQIHVEFDRDKATLKSICRAAEGHGVRACPIAAAPGDQDESGLADGARRSRWPSSRRVLILSAVGIFMAAAWAAPRAAGIPLLAAACAVGGWPTLLSGLRTLRAGSLDMNVLMSLAVVGAAAIGDWWEAASVVALFSLGNLLQASALERTRRSIRGLMDLSPRMARIIRGTDTMDVPAERVEVGEIVLVKPGERIPVDGDVAQGRSTVNEAPITGESLPREKGPGDPVFAGSLNGPAAMRVRTARAARDTTLARILHRVEEAQSQRAPAQQTIDRFARVYTPVVVALAAAVAIIPPVFAALNDSTAQPFGGLWQAWFLKALSLLIIACPCALVISTPVAIVTAIGSASRRGILIKGGSFLEAAGRVTALLYDKTGTLTLGQFRIEQVIPVGSMDRGEILAIAAAIESHSAHPLAAAFVEAHHAEEGHRHVEASEYEDLAGLGARAVVAGLRYAIGSASFVESAGVDVGGAAQVIAQQEALGQTVVLLAEETRLVAVIALADTVRPDSRATVDELRKLGVAHQGMVSGDNPRAAAAIAEAVGLDDWAAGLLPDHKVNAVREAQRKYGVTAMIGDGINDAPALAASSVGIVMGAAGSDTAMETADVALMGDDLSRLPFLVRLSRRAVAVIRQNIAFSIVTKLGLVAAALTVGVPMWLAVAGDMGVSLLVTLNSLRLRH